MMFRSVSAWRAYKGAADRFGCKIPAKILKEITTKVRVIEEVEKWRLTANVDIAGAVLDCIEAGRDPFEDTTVAKRVVTYRVADGERYIYDQACSRLSECLANHLDELVAVLQPPFNQAASVIERAHRLIGTAEDVQAVINQGAEHAAALAEVVNATGRIRQIHVAVRLLLMSVDMGYLVENGTLYVDVNGISPTDHQLVIFRACDEPLRVYEAGMKLSLATPAMRQQRAEDWEELVKAEIAERQRQEASQRPRAIVAAG